jgi:hypothetical protein
MSPVLLTSCDNSELDPEYKNHGNAEYDEHEQDNDPSYNFQGHFSNNHLNNEVMQFNNPSNNDEEDNEVEKQGEKLIYSNISSYLSIKRNKSTAENDSDADYEYDYDESHNIFNWAELIPTVVIYGVTMVFGIAGNSLIIFTICRYRRMKSTTNVFLASLASADLLLIIICIPVKVR